MLKRIGDAFRILLNSSEYLRQQDSIAEFVQLLEGHCEKAQEKVSKLDSLLGNMPSSSHALSQDASIRNFQNQYPSEIIEEVYENTGEFGITFIMPAFNAENHLCAAINSIRHLSLDYQIIIVDDQSTDGSFNLASDFAARDHRIISIQQPTNTGPGTARNVGMQYATKRFIMFVDSDDEIQADGVEYLYSLMLANDSLCIGKGNVYSSPQGGFPVQIDTVEHNAICDVSNYGEIPWYFQAFIFKTSYIMAQHISFPPLRNGEDPVFSKPRPVEYRPTFNGRRNSLFIQHRCRPQRSRKSICRRPNLITTFVKVNQSTLS